MQKKQEEQEAQILQSEIEIKNLRKRLATAEADIIDLWRRWEIDRATFEMNKEIVSRLRKALVCDALLM